MRARAGMCVCVWPVHSMGAPVDVCKGTCICVQENVKGFEGYGDTAPGGDGLAWPFSPYLLLCLISDSVRGTEATLVLPLLVSLSQSHWRYCVSSIHQDSGEGDRPGEP